MSSLLVLIYLVSCKKEGSEKVYLIQADLGKKSDYIYRKLAKDETLSTVATPDFGVVRITGEKCLTEKTNDDLMICFARDKVVISDKKIALNANEPTFEQASMARRIEKILTALKIDFKSVGIIERKSN